MLGLGLNPWLIPRAGIYSLKASFRGRLRLDS